MTESKVFKVAINLFVGCDDDGDGGVVVVAEPKGIYSNRDIASHMNRFVYTYTLVQYMYTIGVDQHRLLIVSFLFGSRSQCSFRIISIHLLFNNNILEHKVLSFFFFFTKKSVCNKQLIDSKNVFVGCDSFGFGIFVHSFYFIFIQKTC